MQSEEVVVKERLTTSRGELILRQRSLEASIQWEIIQDGTFVISTNSSYSSVELVKCGLELLPAQARGIHILIGGLGLGFSLRTALQDERVTRVDVVEWEKAIIGWHLRFLGNQAKEALMDPRTKLLTGNLLEILPTLKDKYHLLALDIDNGPDWLIHQENAGLYSAEFLAIIRDRLEANGVLTIWSHSYQETFMELLRSLFSRSDAKLVLDRDSSGKPIEAYIYRAAL